MSKIDSTRLSAFYHLIYQFSTFESHSAAKILLTDGHQFNALHQIVAKEVIKSAFYLSQFLFRLLRK
jgi:hypothetical protein